MKSSGKQLVSLKQQARWLPADTETPISLYLELVGKGEGILLESAEVDGRWGRYSILACDMCFYIGCQDGKLKLDIKDERFQALTKFNDRPFMDGLRGVVDALEILPPENIKELPPITRAFYGFLGFGMAGIFNPTLKDALPASQAECILAMPRTVLVFDHLYNRLCQISLGEYRQLDFKRAFSAEDEEIRINEEDITAQPDAAGYKEFVRDIVHRLRQGEAIQVVPSVRFSVPFTGNPFTLYRRMRRYNASPYMFYMKFPRIILFGSSPEVMVSCSHDALLLAPIAGTRRRGKTDAEDRQLADELLADPKERAEHVMLVDLGRNDLGRIAKPGAVKVERFMEVERFSHVMHLTSRVTAQLGTDQSGKKFDAIDVLAATFPAGTVSGAPKLRAMEIISSLEKNPRGPYAGCIGWIGLDRDSVNLDMGITIRSMWVKDGCLCWQAGGGIVHDSDPELEWKEVCNKSAIMRLVLSHGENNHVSLDR